MEDVKRGNVVILGLDIRRKPLYDSNEAQIILIKDSFGDPMVMLARTMSDDTWGLCSKGDADWDGMTIKYGLAKLNPNATLQDIVTT